MDAPDPIARQRDARPVPIAAHAVDDDDVVCIPRTATPHGRQEVRQLLSHTTRELDACGIGFVADARGRSSRAIVSAALGGLACVKHRGAVAADARTADGSGVLVPIPAALFGERTGVAVLFV
ncbi:MAG TPA: hypothetical protein VJM75_11945, partial [Acidimicrobiales bacterium]|nr:hypothetical protein [Acidimicrobiales bacterium]